MVGITGGIGSGKSTVARELEKRGYRVYDCDKEAKRLIADNRDVQQRIIALLGEEAFSDGHYNTKYVAQRVFAEPELLTALNAIVHPAVKADILQRSGPTAKGGPTAQRSNSAAVQQPKAVLQPKAVFFIESAILYEAGLDTLCHRVVLVDAPEDLRIARTMARDRTAFEQVRARIRAQRIPRHKNAIVLLNDGTLSIPELVDSLIAKL
jgi:dephospho-CoA kinase